MARGTEKAGLHTKVETSFEEKEAFDQAIGVANAAVCTTSRREPSAMDAALQNIIFVDPTFQVLRRCTTSAKGKTGGREPKHANPKGDKGMRRLSLIHI